MKFSVIVHLYSLILQTFGTKACSLLLLCVIIWLHKYFFTHSLHPKIKGGYFFFGLSQSIWKFLKIKAFINSASYLTLNYESSFFFLPEGGGGGGEEGSDQLEPTFFGQPKVIFR